MNCLMRTSEDFNSLERDSECLVMGHWQDDLPPNADRQRDV